MRISAFWKNSTKILLAMLALMAFSVSAFAQFETGAISGSVTDSQKAVITGAAVTATSQTGVSRSATTDNLGNYVIPSLAPGLYEVKVSHTGFGDYKQRFTVSPGVKTSVNVTLSAQATGETVEVIGTSETQVDTQTSSLNQIVDQTRVAELPSLTRNPYDFVQTLGNVNQDSASGTGGTDEVTRGTGVSINGARSASTNILLDGVENVDLYTTKVGQTVPLDSVQEFSVTTSNFSAEYGRASGGVVNVVTKGGSNNLHGSLYEFNRLSAYTSNDFDSNANGVPKAKYTRNQFGYSVGGPIKKDKLFFFSSTEWLRVRSAANVIDAIPDPAFLAATSAATKAYFNGFTLRPGLTVVQRLNALKSNAVPTGTSSAAYTAYAGATGLGGPVMDIVNYQTPSDSGGGAPQNTWYSSNKVDFNLSDKTTMYGRYSVFNENEFAGIVVNSPYTGFDTGQNELNQNFLYSLTHIWSPRIVTDTKINYSRIKLLQPLASQPIQPSLYFNIQSEATINGNNTCLPGYSCTTPGNSIPFGGPQHIAQIAQSISINKGNHDLRFGGDYLYAQDNRTFGAYENAVEGLESGGTKGGLSQGLDDLMNAQAGWFQVVINPQGKFPCFKDPTGATIVTPGCSVNLPVAQPSFSRSNRYNEFSLYGQDSWKVLPRLTLNLGLRWEYYGTQHNNHQNLDSNFVFGPGNSLVQKIQTGQVFTVAATPNSPASPVGGLWNASPRNFAPRVGFAWDVFGDGKTSLRGGYGMAYERNFGNVTFNVIQNPPAQFNSIFQGTGTVAAPFIPLAGLNNLGPFAGTGTKPLPNPSLRYVRQDIPTAYTESWNLSVERQVLHNSLFALEYSGQRGIHLYSIENLNQQGAGVVYGGADVTATGNPLERLNLQYGNMNTRGADGFSYYNSLNTRFNSNNLFHQGLNMSINYTWSHTIDNLSSTFSETPQTENLGLLDPFQPALDKGDADYDARHRIAISAVWDLPYAKETHGWVKQVLDGWQMDPIFIAHTGNPFTVFDSSAGVGGDTAFARYFIPTGTTIPFTGSTSTPATSPNTFTYLTLQPSATYAEPLTGSGEFPTCNMVTNSAGDLVSTGQNCRWPANMVHRNAFRGPGAYFVNFAVRKSFQITERYGLQFSSEAYNLLNHSNYYVQSGGTQDLGNGPNTAPFAVIGKRGVNPNGITANERRFIQFALRLNF
ncbi:MAG TPA: TonB-dependent receptor [Terriglobales bacterium]|jgi:hypothetical protein|nr:TonB-dependent receptor [Terriglobales bacterium]